MSCYQQIKPVLRICTQKLKGMQEALKQMETVLVNWKRVLFLHDNVKPHMARVDRYTIHRLVWESSLLPRHYHPPYSSGLAPTYYHLFHSLDKHLRGKSFANKAGTHRFLYVQRHLVYTVRALCNLKYVGKSFWMPMGFTLRTNGMPTLLYTIFFLIN